MPDAHRGDQASLRVEHDDLARRLEIRPSVDAARSGLVLAFAGLVSAGLCWALLRDRHVRLDGLEPGLVHPVLFSTGWLLAGVLGVVLVLRGILVLRRSRRMAREEASLFERLRELRRLLELDA